MVRSNVEKAKVLVEKGGDWERRNLLKVYESVYLLLIRDFKGASSLLVDSISTFTCYALIPYTSFVLYAVTAALITLGRVQLNKDIIKSPEILSTISEVPHLRKLLVSLYECQYKDCFAALGMTLSFVVSLLLALSVFRLLVCLVFSLVP